MTTSFENMLYLFGQGSSEYGLKLDNTNSIDLNSIRQHAIEQGIWSIVYKPLSNVCDTSEYNNEIVFLIVKGMRQREFQLSVIRKMEKAGIECCILKGVVTAQLYMEPDYRISSDFDILINPNDEKKAIDFLLENGYNIKKRTKNGHHTVAYHEIGGMLELHIKLYGYLTEHILFNDMIVCKEPYITININGYNYKTLGINDNLMYLTGHYIKHFVNGGGGIRQMMDLLLYIKKYENKIDFKMYDEILEKLSYKKLIDVVKSIGAKYFGLKFDITEADLMDKILSDMEIGGIFGHASGNRINFCNEYYKKRSDVSKLKIKTFLWFKSEATIFDRIFKSKQSLVDKGYNYARYSILVPIAQIHNILNGIIRNKKIKNSDEGKKEFNARLNLMKDLNMIK